MCAGVTVVDSSVRPGLSGRTFTCRCMLLYWTGDYPAQAAVSGTHSKCCHWCCLKSEGAPEINRQFWGGMRRLLPGSHELRRASSAFGPQESRPPPEPLSHNGYVENGLANEAHERLMRLDPQEARKQKKFLYNRPYKFHGVKEASPLRFLPMFDLVWDVLPDFMHINTGIMHRHIMEVIRGARTPAAVRQRKKNTKEELKQLDDGTLTKREAAELLAARNKKLLEDHRDCLVALEEWAITDTMGAVLDARSLALAGEASWVRSGMQVYTHKSALTSHDWLVLVQGAGDYLFAELYDDRNKQKTLDSLLTALRACITVSSPCNVDNREDVDKLKLQVVEALCLCEAFLPRTELAVMFHVLSHVPDCVFRWNSVRNFWCFFGERSVSVFFFCRLIC